MAKVLIMCHNCKNVYADDVILTDIKFTTCPTCATSKRMSDYNKLKIEDIKTLYW